MSDKLLMKPLLSVHDVSVYLAVSERTIYRLIKDRRLLAYRVGGQWRLDSDQVDAWMKKDAEAIAAL